MIIRYGLHGIFIVLLYSSYIMGTEEDCQSTPLAEESKTSTISIKSSTVQRVWPELKLFAHGFTNSAISAGLITLGIRFGQEAGKVPSPIMEFILRGEFAALGYVISKFINTIIDVDIIYESPEELVRSQLSTSYLAGEAVGVLVSVSLVLYYMGNY